MAPLTSTFRVPDRDREMLLGLLKLDSNQGQELSASIDGSDGTFASISNLIAKYALDGSGALGALMSLMVVQRKYRIDTETLVTSLQSSFEVPEGGDGLRSLLRSGKIKRFAKAYALRNEYERILTDSRIMSDVRPVFDDDEETPSIQAATVNHALRLTYRAGDGDSHDVHIALDIDDLKKLKRQIDRAIGKDKAAQELLKTAEVDVLGPMERPDRKEG